MAGILKKLFSKKGDQSSDTPAKPTVEHPQASHQSGAGNLGKSKIINRAPRVSIKPIGTVFFSQITPVLIKRVEAANISITGIGLLKSFYPVAPEPGSLLHGMIVLGSNKFQVVLKAIHMTANVVGSQFQNPSPELVRGIDEFFKVEIAAAGTVKVDPKYHKKDADGSSFWIHGDHVDLYYVCQAEKVRSFRLTVFDRYLEYSPENGLRYGILQLDDPAVKPTLSKGANLVVTQSSIEPEQLDIILNLLKHIPHISEMHRREITVLITEKS